MNKIYNSYIDYIIVYIDDVLINFDNIDQHFKHLNIFVQTTKKAGLAVNQKKVKLFQTKIKFLGHYIENGIMIPIERAIVFADKFPDKITDVNQLQRFLGSLNYIGDFYKDLARDCKLLFQRLKKNPQPWTNSHTLAIQKIKERVKELPCLSIANPEAFKIVETDVSDIGYGGILKQKLDNTSKEILVRYTSRTCNNTQKNYSTIKKEILSIVKCITKFESDLLNKKFLLRVDCKSAKDILLKDFKVIVFI